LIDNQAQDSFTKDYPKIGIKAIKTHNHAHFKRMDWHNNKNNIGSNKMDWNSKEYVLDQVKKYGWLLQYACEKLKSDIEVVFTAINTDSLSYMFVSDSLKKQVEETKTKLNVKCYHIAIDHLLELEKAKKEAKELKALLKYKAPKKTQQKTTRL